MTQLQLEIITPERIVFRDDVDAILVPTSMGQIGILPRHIPLFTLLTEGELVIKKSDQEYYLAIGGGFLEVTHEKVSILVTRAVAAEQLHEQEILAAKNEAQLALKEKPKGEALLVAQTLLRQSIVDLHILRRRKKSVSH